MSAKNGRKEWSPSSSDKSGTVCVLEVDHVGDLGPAVRVVVQVGIVGSRSPTEGTMLIEESIQGRATRTAYEPGVRRERAKTEASLICAPFSQSTNGSVAGFPCDWTNQ